MTRDDEPRTYTARWVFPVAGPPLPGGTVTVRGDKIEAVEPAGVRSADVDLGNVAVIPGLVNAHVHLDLSGARGRTPPTDAAHFTDWLRSVIAYRRSRSPAEVQADIRDGLAECLRTGTTLLGDIAADGASWDAVSAAPVRAVLGWEIIGLSAERYDAVHDEFLTKTGLGWFNDTQPAVFPPTPLCHWWAAPHAPYSANHDRAAGQLFLGYAMLHLAETPAELELLTNKTGPFVQFLSALGLWNPALITAKLTDFLYSWEKPNWPRVYVHCNYLPPDAPLRPRDTVVYCPRTHAAFGHPPHPFRDFLARGVRVALGTDGLSSNPDLDLLADARFVHARHPDFAGDALLKMATLAGAEALGWADETGSLEAGKSADLVAVPLPDREAADPHELLFAAAAPVGGRRTMFRGEWREV